MDITQLKYFLKTAETLNYTQAAHQLFISRQALRQALAGMEKELGTPLFDNERNKLTLTAQGEYLYLTGRRVVNSFDEMVEGLQRFGKEKEIITVAFSVSLFPFILPEADQIVRRFRNRYPSIGLETVQMTNDEVFAAVTDGRVACGAAIQMPCRRAGMTGEILSRYDAILSYGERFLQLSGKEVTPEDLAGLPCCGFGSLQESMRPFYEECCRKGITLDYDVVPDAIDAFYRITHGQAVGLDLLKEDVPEFGRICASRLKDFNWEVGLYYREDAKQWGQLQILLRFIREEYERMQ